MDVCPLPGEVCRDGPRLDFDYAIIGSGFGGSVAALRLTEKGYRVVVWRRESESRIRNRGQQLDLKRWLWLPALGCRGPYRISPFRHLVVLSGVGVGGGSLIYANTLAMPGSGFFDAPSWAHLADWQTELAPHYDTARRIWARSRIRAWRLVTWRFVAWRRS